ncbi:MAG: HAD family phosphatase [Acidobacteria bacterium]|nr:MAG: HAD family phosphatase [Acidobacteriota bacterium]RPJ86852.1 MAG: HAD family phosphatase [Acidobacteriota bacterium]
MTTRINTFLLDVGQVLVALDYPAALRSVMRYTQLPGEEISKRMSGNQAVLLYESGKLPTQKFYEITCRLLEMQVSLEDFKRGWGDMFALQTPEGQCISATLFRELKRSYRVVALSNTNEMHWEYLESVFPLIHEFDDYILSFRVGTMKPDPVIYRAALNCAGCAPAEAFFIDDLPVNIQAAEELGIKGILYQGEAQLRADLLRLGLLEPTARL